VSRPAAACPECGAPLAPGRSCRDYFHDLLALEAEVPGAAGEEPHFLAVASYNLQHPSGFLPDALLGLRRAVADVLAGRATVADVRRQVRAATDGSTRVRRRGDGTVSGFSAPAWTMTVRDVSEVAPEQYAERVRAWAASVSAALGA
jgi:hypothetical protein